MKNTAKDLGKSILSHISIVLPRFCTWVDMSVTNSKGYQITFTTYVLGINVEEDTVSVKDLLDNQS